jgi:putative oxygen-independent coproporphyrinogen III oxidase
MTLPPLSLYVHFPWCVRKCPYCDFNSHSLQGELPEASYVEALRVDLATQVEEAQGRSISSLFFGGGTPSLFSPAALAGLLQALHAELPIDADAEITLEANPGTIERGDFAGYRAAGINRVSLGAQSFDDASLARLGRIHAAADTQRAVAELRSAGIENFNLDLMYALPSQTPSGALADIEQALRLEPTHISHYQLTLEPGTLFAARPPPALPAHDAAAQMQSMCQQRLGEAGFAQYEVSAYAPPERRCRHNLNYWRFGDYLGVGAGAHGKLSHVEAGQLRIERSWREREPRRYLANHRAPPQRRAVSRADLPFEFLMNALRLPEGFEERMFEERTGLAIENLAGPLGRAQARGLLEHDAVGWRASPLGFSFLNDLLAEFLEDPAPAPAAAAERPGTESSPV